MTKLTPSANTRTHPDLVGMTRNDTHKFWTYLDKSGQIWTEPDIFSQNSQSRTTKLSKTARILRPTLTQPASATAPRTSDGSDPGPPRCRATEVPQTPLRSGRTSPPDAPAPRPPSLATTKPPWSQSSGSKATPRTCPFSRNTSGGRINYCCISRLETELDIVDQQRFRQRLASTVRVTQR